MTEYIATGTICACTAFAFVQMIQPGEVFALYGKWVNKYLDPLSDMPNPNKLKGFKYVIYKYHYCAFCLSGIIALVSSLYLYQNFTAAVVVPCVAMTTARIIESLTN